MPTTRRRLQLTLSDQVWALVDEVHKLTGTPKAAIVSEILDELAPVFMTQLEALRLMQSAPRQAQELMKQFSDKAIEGLAQHNLEFDELLTKHEAKQQSLELPADGRTVQGKRARRRKHGAP